MPLNPSAIHKILFITLSNIGDVVLTLPALDIVRANFPKAQLHVMVGPKAQSLFDNNPHIDRVIIFDKHLPFWELGKLTLSLRREKYDLVVDLRHSAMPIFLGAKNNTSLFGRNKTETHMMRKHCARLNGLVNESIPVNDKILVVPEILQKKCDEFAALNLMGKPFVVIAPGSANHAKQWTVEGYAQLADYLVADKTRFVVFVGDKNDRDYISYIHRRMTGLSVDLSGRISLLELAGFLKKAELCVVNDSAPMHLASYFDVPTVAIFGPTDPLKYGPWGRGGVYLQNNNDCRKCKDDAIDQEHSCMSAIKFDVVKESVEKIIKAFPRNYESN